jgi:hypothetical protein
MDLVETGFWGMEWTNLVQDMNWWRALANTLMNPQVP